MSYTLSKIDTHRTGKWTIYELTATSTGFLQTSPSDTDENNLDKTRHEARKEARVVKAKKVKKVKEETEGELSF
jgi:hypothetical protein